METGLSVLQAFPSEHVLVSLGKANMAKMDPDMMTEKVVFVLDNDGLDYCQDRLICRSSLERICTEVSQQIFNIIFHLALFTVLITITSPNHIHPRATERLLEACKSVYVVFPPLLEGTRKTDMNDILQR